MGEEAIKPLSVSSIDLEPAVRVRAVETLGDVGGKKAIPPLYKALSDSDGQVRWEAVLAAPKAGIPIKFLPRALARRPRMRRNPYIAGLLNFLIPGIGYFWLGNWWGVIIFQMDIYLTLLLWQVYGESVLDFLLPIYLILGIHARNMPDL
jgi:hypothetical protein